MLRIRVTKSPELFHHAQLQGSCLIPGSSQNSSNMLIGVGNQVLTGEFENTSQDLPLEMEQFPDQKICHRAGHLGWPLSQTSCHGN